MMNTINEKFGRHLTVSRKASKEESEQSYDKTPRYHVVAVVKFKSGKTGIKVIPRIISRILEYYNGMIASGDVSEVSLYMAKHPYFNRYPNSSALKAQYIEIEEIKPYLKDAKPLQCDGSRIVEK